MDRLTRRNSYGVSFIKPLDPDCGNCNISLNTMCGDHFNAITERLAAYEDTGLKPDEIPQLKAKLNEEVSRRYQAECNYDHTVKDRDTLQKALELMAADNTKVLHDMEKVGIIKITKDSDTQSMIGYYIQQAQQITHETHDAESDSECAYKTSDGYCELHSDGMELREPCLDGPCCNFKVKENDSQ